MTSFVVPFLRRKPASTDWGQAELAEFYRVEAALIAAGMRVQTDRGMTDEGDPWFVFCHADDEQDVIIHFARIDGSYLVSASSLGNAEVGGDFRTLVRRLLAQYDEIATRRRDTADGKSGKVLLHPAAMLWVLVAVAFLKSAEARPPDGMAAPHDAAEHDPAAMPMRGNGFDPLPTMIVFALQSISITWTAAIGAVGGEIQTGSDNALLSWLAAEPVSAPQTGTILTAVDPLSAHLPESDHGSHETVVTDHAGSSGAPMTMPIATASEHLVPELGSDHVTPEPLPATIAHVATELAPVQAQVMADPIPVRPVTEAQAVLTAAETNITSKPVETPAIVPNAIATVLNHAIHPLGGDSVESTTAQAKEILQTLSAEVSALVPSNKAEATTFLSDQARTEPAVSLSDHPTAPNAATSTVITVVAPPVALAPAVAGTLALPSTPSVPAPAVPATVAMLDQSKLAVATSAVHEFLASTPQAKTITVQNTLIVYDPLAVDIDQAHLQALTFDFSDGSHISLIGLPSELAHALTGHS